MRLRHLPILIIVLAAYSSALVLSTVVLTLALRPKPIFKIAPVIIATLDAAPSPESFDPAYYGLPEAIAGYKIIAVETSANMACMIPGNIKLVLQSSQPDVESFLKNAPGANVDTELQKLSLKPKQWELEYVGTGISRETVLSVAKQRDPRNTELCDMLRSVFGRRMPASTPDQP